MFGAAQWKPVPQREPSHVREPAISSQRRSAVRHRLVALLSVTALLGAGTLACTTAQQVSTAWKVKHAVDKLGERESVSMTARFDATPEQIHSYLQQGRGTGKGPRARENAQLLADLELAVSLSADEPLRELTDSDRADSAAAVNFGGLDVFAYKSIDKKLYVRMNASALAQELGERDSLLGRVAELGKLPETLPPSLDTAKSALKGKWVRVNPREFGEFSEALGGRAGAGSDRAADSTVLLRSATLQQRLVSAVENALGEHASFTAAGHHQGADHVTLKLPARTVGRQLAAALRPVQPHVGELDLSVLERAPDRTVEMDLAIRHETLSTLTVDLGQFDDGRTGRLPLQLKFAGGEAVSVAAPTGAGKLHPDDLLAALAYVSVRGPELSNQL